MRHSDDRHGNSTECATGQCVDSLSETADGDVHLLVTFETAAAGTRTDGGDVAEGTFRDPDQDPDPGPESGARSDRDEPDRADVEAEFDEDTEFDLAECEPFVDTVMRPGASSDEFTDSAFGESIDVESLVSYLGLDFVEHQLFAERFRLDADVVYTSRGVGSYQLLCVYLADRGLLLVVDDDEAIRPLVSQARGLLTET